VAYTFVIVGLRRTIDPSDARGLALTCLDAAEKSGMPVDPRAFLRDPPGSTHPAGLAITAVAEARSRRSRRRCGVFGTMATPEVAAVCDMPGPRAPAELWRLALDWRVKARDGLWELG
jgi:hypothetical protein